MSAKTVGIVGVIGLAVFGVYKLFTKTNAVGQLRYTLKEVKLSYKNLRLLVVIDLIVTNPTKENLKFEHFTGKLYADNNFLGYVDIPNQTLIAAGKDSIVSLSTVIPANTVIDLLFKNLATLKLPTTGIIDGIAKIGSFQIKVKESFNFNEPKSKSNK